MNFRNPLNFVLSLFIIYAFLAAVPVAYNIFAIFSMAIIAINLAEWLMRSTRNYILYKKICPQNKAVLITGCDSGFGNNLAKRMDKLGYQVFAACLNAQGEGAKELLTSCSENLVVLSMDVTSDKSIQEVTEFVSRNLKNNELWAIVNNAGISHASEIDWTSFKELQNVYDVNTGGTIRVIKAFLPFLKKSKGRIINNISIAGRITFPGFVGYCMSKHALVSLTTGLRIELAKWGIKVSYIEPFFYSTPITDTEATWKLVEKTWRNAPADIREQYGEKYKESFKRRASATFRSFCNPRIYEVIDCFEDAVTAEEPMATYFPCSLPYKIGLKISLILPNTTLDKILQYLLDGRTRPVALRRKNENPGMQMNGKSYNEFPFLLKI